jgi:hypothetical protein
LFAGIAAAIGLLLLACASVPAQAAPTNEPLATLTGHVTWQGRPAQPNPLQQLPLTLILQMGGTRPAFNLTTDAHGNFSVALDGLPHGTYTWWVKGPQYLAGAGTVTLDGTSRTVEMGVQRAGDVNNDNLVDTTDFSLLRANYGRTCGASGYDARTEFTGDCLVDVTDFTLLRGNFGQAGAAPPPVLPTSTPTRTATTAPATNTPTRTPTRTPTSGAATSTPTQPPAGPCQVFPPDNYWNRTITHLPLHPQSAAYINSIGLNEVLHPDFARGSWQGETIGIPFIEVPGTQPRVPMTFQYASESDPGPYPVPTNAPIEGGPNALGDRHVIVIDRDNCVLYEMYKAYPNADGSWRAGSGAKWSLNSNALRRAGWTSADAAGLPIRPGLVTYDEVASGVIRHAIRFTTQRINSAYIWPARHSDGDFSDSNVPPMGVRLRLKAGVDISGYPARVRVVLQALKDYGMVLADTGGPLNISGTHDSRWNDAEMNQMEGIRAADFEVVDTSGMMVHPDSGQTR